VTLALERKCEIVHGGQRGRMLRPNHPLSRLHYLHLIPSFFHAYAPCRTKVKGLNSNSKCSQLALSIVDHCLWYEVTQADNIYSNRHINIRVTTTYSSLYSIQVQGGPFTSSISESDRSVQ